MFTWIYRADILESLPMNKVFYQWIDVKTRCQLILTHEIYNAI